MWLALLVACTSAPPVPGPQDRGTTSMKLRTEDGATIALHHHYAAGPPVLLVHGIASNHYFWDLDAEHSLAAWLAERGHDVWLLDLRGHGDALTDEDGVRQFGGWNVDDYGKYDVATAIDHIRSVTGYRTVAYVGHSMGGMVGAIYAVTHGDSALSCIVTAGSPATFAHDAKLVGLAQAAMQSGGVTLGWVETPVLATMARDLGPATPGHLQERLYNPENYEPETIRHLLETIVSPVTRGEMRQFGRMLRDERFESQDGSVDYRAEMRTITVPTFAIGGAHDEIVHPAWAQAYSDAVGGEHRFFLASRAEGLAHDYGHLDYGLGESASTEIFPRIALWLDAHPPER